MVVASDRTIAVLTQTTQIGFESWFSNFRSKRVIILKTEKEIDGIRKSCRLAVAVLDMITEHIKPGVSTLELNALCHEYTQKHGGISAPLNYKGFPKSICTSVNEVICHGIPSAKQKLKNGDIINVDITTIVDGFYGDTSRTFYVGDKVSD